MILQKKTINNVPTLVPLTADTGSGVPVGTIIGQYKKVNMAGYLYLDGSTFDQTLYPALYAYLGTNVLPDYREFVLVGAEQNTTSATIADHDVFTQGQEKDDQLQNHTILVKTNTTGAEAAGGSNYDTVIESRYDRTGQIAAEIYPNTARVGTTTRTKEKAVFWYIKATTGIIESEATEMLNVINNNISRSLGKSLDDTEVAEITKLPGITGSVYAYRKNGIVSIHIAGVGNLSNSADYEHVTIATLDAKYRPKLFLSQECTPVELSVSSSAFIHGYLHVATDGNIAVDFPWNPRVSKVGYLQGSFTYVAADI